ncbi:beta-lactamase family protein [bacterium]|nr:beta-lactamase family protein [bacterium]
MQILKNTTLALIMLISLAIMAYGQSPAIQRVDNLMKEVSESDQFSGNVLIAKDGNVIYSKSFGMADKDLNIPNNEETKFNIGSIGKFFTSIAILQLAEAGKLNLTDSVEKYLPDFPKDKSQKITIHQLLLHTSGLSNYMTHPDYADKKHLYRSIDDVLPLIKNETLEFEPGERFGYSNSGYIVLGAIIEKVSGKKYAAYIQENIWQPAGMKDTGLFYKEQTVENRATGYVKDDSGSMITNALLEPPAFSDGGAYSTVTDLLKFDLALQNNTLLSEENSKLWFAPQGGPFAYGPAFVPADRSFCGKEIYGGMGGAPGISASFNHISDDNYTIIILSNYDEIAMRLFPRIESTLYGKD